MHAFICLIYIYIYIYAGHAVYNMMMYDPCMVDLPT